MVYTIERMERSKDENLLSIGQTARESGLSHKALRLYAELGLLIPRHTDRFTGYRYYGREQLRSAQLIRLMREMEMPLSEIRRVLAAEPAAAEQLVDAHARAFAERLERVRHAGRRLIKTMRNEVSDMGTNLQVEERELTSQQVATISGHVLAKDLDDFIRQSLERLEGFVKAQGGEINGPPLGIFHGPINMEDDGPIEVCYPARGAFQARNEIAIRELPGGRAAVVEVRDEYLSFPKILEAYDAGADWVAANGHHPVEAPREVWIGLPDAGGPLEIVWRFE